MYTIRQKPITGVGYGQKFYIIMQLPDISFFAWWEYIVHNSIMWMWMKGGLGTYYSMLIMIGSALMTGVRAFWRMPGKDMSAITLTGLLYILMHFVYAYVDMSWDAQSMLYVGMTMGALNCAERVAAQPVPLEERRYPWQPAPEPAPGLRPFPQAAG
jgi:O-antigen ligase